MSFSILFISMLACSGSQNNGFSSLGQTSLDPDSMMNQSGGGTDTGDLDDDIDPNAPFVSEAIAFFAEVTGVGDVIEVHLMYIDEQDDIMGGQVDVSYYSSTESESLRVDINGTDALVEEGEITFLFQDVDPSDTYTFDMKLTDAAGNQSNEIQAAAVPVN